MPWSKTKTVVVASAILLLTGGISMVGARFWRAANPPDISGAWEGSSDIGNAGVLPDESEHTRIVMRILKTNGAYRATVDLIDVGMANISLGKFVYDHPKIHAEGELGPMISFDATVNFTGSKISGTVPQINGGMPISLHRTRRPTSVPTPLEKDEYASSDGGLQGLWEGKLGQIKLSWKIAGQPNGSYRAELDNHQFGNRQPVRVTFNSPNVELRVMSGSGMFEGELSDAKLIGDWVQSGRRTRVTFSRVDLPVYQPIADNEPEIAERIRNLRLQEFQQGECTPEFWQKLQRKRNPAIEKAVAEALGELKTITLVERTEHNGRQSYRYRIEYEKANVIYHIEFERGKIALADGTPE